ncbi:hypothetical protein M422DRAFT_25993 [Sphaerobolus stellatus SS14]|nr:hypothetical protein M422DRAFT_25993 [Sphaerobolus stellatus SS14]
MAYCTRVVFRCFKCLERAADRITGAAGPFFITIAYVLLSIGTFAFFEIVAPTLSFPVITIPICILFATNMFANYYYVCTVPPGFVDDPAETQTTREGRGILWARKQRNGRALQWSDQPKLSEPQYNKCKRCGIVRPERAHHCKICKRCVLKYDHHCPGVNQCVGIHNERYFVLFMAWLIVCSFCFFTLGWPTLWASFDYFDESWNYWTPSWAFMLEYILSAVICLCLIVMCGWHLWSVMNGETSVDNHDFDGYRKLAKSRGDTFINCYDLGYRRNLELFFNLGPNGYPYWVLLLPLRTAPYTDGKHWAKRDGMTRHKGVREHEEYTDDEED